MYHIGSLDTISQFLPAFVDLVMWPEMKADEAAVELIFVFGLLRLARWRATKFRRQNHPSR